MTLQTLIRHLNVQITAFDRVSRCTEWLVRYQNKSTNYTSIAIMSWTTTTHVHLLYQASSSAHSRNMVQHGGIAKVRCCASESEHWWALYIIVEQYYITVFIFTVLLYVAQQPAITDTKAKVSAIMPVGCGTWLIPNRHTGAEHSLHHWLLDNYCNTRSLGISLSFNTALLTTFRYCIAFLFDTCS